MGKGVKKAYSLIRNVVSYQAGDAWWGPEIEKVKTLVLSGDLALKEIQDEIDAKP